MNGVSELLARSTRNLARDVDPSRKWWAQIRRKVLWTRSDAFPNPICARGVRAERVKTLGRARRFFGTGRRAGERAGALELPAGARSVTESIRGTKRDGEGSSSRNDGAGGQRSRLRIERGKASPGASSTAFAEVSRANNSTTLSEPCERELCGLDLENPRRTMTSR